VVRRAAPSLWAAPPRGRPLPPVADAALGGLGRNAAKCSDRDLALHLGRLDDLSEENTVPVDPEPTGDGCMEDFHTTGGRRALLREPRDLTARAAAAGGTLALVETGGRVRSSDRDRRLDLLVEKAELARRRAAAGTGSCGSKRRRRPEGRTWPSRGRAGADRPCNRSVPDIAAGGTEGPTCPSSTASPSSTPR
jgi:Dehydratase family